MTFKTDYLKENNLVFGDMREEKDQRIGLERFGPFRYPSEKGPLGSIKLGIIGNKQTIEKSKDLIEFIADPIDSPKENKWLFPPFPGISKNTKFDCNIEISNSWQETILQSDINKILKIIDVNERIGAAVNLYLTKIENLAKDDNPPDVVLCSLPQEIEDYCGISTHTREAKTLKPTELEKKILEARTNQRFLTEWGASLELRKEKKPRGFDFRSALKGKAMAVEPARPIQLLRETTIDSILKYQVGGENQKQDPASFAWNFSTALLYKANIKLWRPAKLRQDTCFVGISFYRDKFSYNKNIQTAMAQIFTHDGQGLVLKGTEVYIDEKTKEPHLSQKQAEELLLKAIKEYKDKANRSPGRVVIHKSTLFTAAEMDGFNAAIGNLKKDFVTISRRNKGIRFLRTGSYPVLRGTLITLTDKEFILYTSGYTPRLRSYPGHSIPNPLFITHIGDTETKEVCGEILDLTRLNWNTTAFATFMPITLAFASKVGEILSEANKDLPLQPHYRFYM